MNQQLTTYEAARHTGQRVALAPAPPAPRPTAQAPRPSARPQPQPSVGARSAPRLPTWPLPPEWVENGVGWFAVGCHGGAGASTLAAAVKGGGLDGGRYWPLPSHGSVNVVMVARTHAAGLRAAQYAARQWAEGALPPTVRLLGLAAVADAPGKLPKPLKQLLELISGGLPRLWLLPWVEALRLGDPADQIELPPAYAAMAADLQQLVYGASHA